MVIEGPYEPGVRVLPATSATAWQDAQALRIAAELELAQAQEHRAPSHRAPGTAVQVARHPVTGIFSITCRCRTN